MVRENNVGIIYVGFVIGSILSAFIYYTTKDLKEKEVPKYL